MSASPWIARWSHLLAPGCSVLDVACGGGRHLAWFLARGHAATGIDRDLDPALHLKGSAHLIAADIEDAPWPLMAGGAPQTFGAVVVTNYLWRPLLPTIVASVAPGGVLLYETFAIGNERFGRPSRADFLLQPGELLTHCAGMHVVAYEHGTLSDPPRVVQRIAAVRPAHDTPVSQEIPHAL